MLKRIPDIRIILLAVGLLVCMGSFPAKEKHNTLAPTAIVVAEKHDLLLLAQKDAQRLDFISLGSNELQESLELAAEPRALVYDANNKVYVACGEAQSFVYAIDLDSRTVKERFRVGFGASALRLSKNKDYLYVSNQFSNNVSVISIQEKKEICKIPVLRQPKELELSADGKHLFVANFLPEGAADEDLVSAAVSVIDVDKCELIKNLRLSNGSNALLGMCKSADGKYILLTHNIGRFQIPTSQLAQGWMNNAALTLIDAEKISIAGTVLLDDPEHGAANPWGITANEDFICIAHAGTHELSVIDYRKFIEVFENVGNKEELIYTLGFLKENMRRRIPLEGLGPRALSLHDQTLYAALYFSDKLQKINLNAKLSPLGKDESKVVDLNPDFFIDSVKMGEILFHDARKCFQQWQSCVSCHPDNARVDALNWDLMNDGLGNPKNCKSMLQSHLTPPAMITGVRASAEVAVRAGFRYIQFAAVDEASSRAVDAYLRSLKAVPSPHLVNGKLSKSAKKGEKLFKQLGCAECHPKPMYTDLQSYSIGTKSPLDEAFSWDTPTLQEIWRTGPYLHDGRCATLEDLILEEKHELNKNLSEEECKQLRDFLLSL